MWQGSLTISGGTISGNTAGTHGGAIMYSGGTASMTGGTISGNSATSYAGGIYVDNGTFVMTGGNIKNNIAGKLGGGVFVETGNHYKMSNEAFIEVNPSNNDVYLQADTFITVDGALKSSGQAARVTPDTYSLGRTCIRAAYDDTIGSDIFSQFALTENSPYFLQAGDLEDERLGVPDTDLVVSLPYNDYSVSVSAKIKETDVNFSNGNPTLLFKLEGTDIFGDISTCYQVLELTEAETAANGYYVGNVVFSNVVSGEYLLEPLEISRYEVTGAKTFSLDLSDELNQSAAFEFEKYENQWFSHNDVIVNRITQ